MKPISFTFDFKHKLIVLSVIVNGRKTLRVVLDTGMPGDGMLLFKTRRVEEIDLNYSSRLVAGGDSIKSMPVMLADDVVLDFPGLRLSKQSVLVIDGNPFPVQMDIDGIVGYALFSRYAVKLNFDQYTLRCWSPADYRQEDNFVEIPIEFREGFPYIPCTIGIQDSDPVDVAAYLDLGAVSTVALNADAHPQFKFNENAIESKVSSALGGTVNGRVDRIESLQIAAFTMSNIVATSCCNELSRCAEHEDTHEASIGMEVIRRFVTVIDYSSKRLYLARGEAFNEPFLFNMSGLSVRKMKLGHFQIEHVTPCSPGTEAGLQAGDIIVRINDRQANKVSIEEMNDLLGRDDAFVLLVSRKFTLMKFIVNPRVIV